MPRYIPYSGIIRDAITRWYVEFLNRLYDKNQDAINLYRCVNGDIFHSKHKVELRGMFEILNPRKLSQKSREDRKREIEQWVLQVLQSYPRGYFFLNIKITLPSR